MTKPKIYTMVFAKIYPMYIQKAEKKGRTKDEVDQVICWLTGYDSAGLQAQIDSGASLETFFANAPHINEKASLVTGMICGHRIEEIDNPLTQNIRRLDKLIDELAKGRSIDKITRNAI